ncbi:MAG: SusD/RagB family nutrient-binding outer membrane lipoprotein [Flavobacteriales bacterium]
MKNINKISIFLMLVLAISFTSCETTDLDLINDPNQITQENADLERFLVAIQIDFKTFAERMGRNGAQLTRIEQMGSTTYLNAFDPSSTNDEWRLAYQNMFSDMKIAQAQAEEIGATKHQAVMNILKAYTLMTLVDYFGDVPLSQAINSEEFPSPEADDDASVYEAALGMLDQALTQLNGDGLPLSVDYYYNNDFDKWKDLANTLKMNAYLNTRLVDGSAMNKFNAIVDSGNFISDASGDFEFHYETVVNDQIDARHPAYQADYTSGGANRYRSNWIMDEMLNDNDPRIRYYFFRQNDCTPGNIGADGNECPPDPEPLFCSTDTPPPHYPADMVFCSVADGYWGRDHGFAGGIPPDTFLRTAVGVYPAAGNFDDDRFTNVNLGQGGEGAGITPIMLASWVDFMRAEMALANNNASQASGYLQEAMQKSIDKVMSFGSVDPDGDLAGFAPTSDEVTTYINDKVNMFLNADDNGKWEILALQQFVAHYGNGSDSYNMYRRTGYPHSLQYTIDPNPGNFVRSFLYPADEANTNINITQKPNVDQQVFWDNNPPSPGFPQAN